MILYICIYLLNFVYSQTSTIAPINPLVVQKNLCEEFGADLNGCEAETECTFYDISGREVFTLKSPVQVFTSNGWASGEVTAVHQAVGQDDITVEYLCPGGTSEHCTVTDARFSMRFREQNSTEIEGIRVTYPATKQQEKLDRLESDSGVTPVDINSRISQMDGDEWADVWIYAAYGEVVGLQGPDLIISKAQDCLLNPTMIPIYAEEIRREHDQVPQATFCTAIWTEFDCERKTNCYWEETVCLANRWTNDLLTCWEFKNETSCAAQTEPNCYWLEPELKGQYDRADSYCVCCSATQLNLAILFSLLLIIFMC